MKQEVERIPRTKEKKRRPESVLPADTEDILSAETEKIGCTSDTAQESCAKNSVWPVAVALQYKKRKKGGEIRKGKIAIVVFVTLCMVAVVMSPSVDKEDKAIPIGIQNC